MKKILCLIDGLNSGGAQRQLVGLANLLQKRGYTVLFVWYHNTDFYKQFLDENKISYRQLAPKGKFSKFWLVSKEIYRFNPDVVIAYIDGPTMISCFLKGLGLKYKLIVSERNTTQLINKHVRLKFWLYRIADYIVPNSYSQASFISNNFHVLENKVKIITNFVDTNSFCPSPLKSKHEKVYIMCAGRLYKQKNILRFAEAISKVRERGFSFEVHWFGSSDRKGDYEQKCKELVSDLNLNDVFYFEGSIKNIKTAYQEADVFCLPSIYEGFPNVICEAMSSGLPILASNVCDNGRLVEDGINGFLFNPLDLDSIVDAIKRFLILSVNERLAMGKKNREKALELFSEARFLEKYEELICD